MKIRIVFLALLLSACSFGGAQATPTLALPTAPTASPTPLPGIVLLVAPDAADAKLAEVNQAAASFAAAQGLVVETRGAITAAELPANLVALLLMAPDPGAEALAAAAPQARVVTIGFSSETAAANLVSVAAGGTAGSQDAAFIAGYMAALSAPDWRSGILYSAASSDLVDAYRAGATYFCGTCVPSGPPNSRYPIAAQAAAPDNWQAAVDQLMIEFVRVVYLAPEMENSGAAQYLATYGVTLLGSGAPPPEVAGSWIASLNAQSGASLQTQVEQALAGQAPSAPAGITVEQLNTSLFSTARLETVQTVIADLLSGAIRWDGLP